MAITNTRYGIKSVSFRAAGSSGSWTAMTVPTDAESRWQIKSGPVPNPIDFQITDEWGQVVVDTNVQLSISDVTGKVQFTQCS